MLELLNIIVGHENASHISCAAKILTMSQENRLHWSSAALSHTGKVRHINEDSCLALPEVGLWAVADGMGGHESGGVASRMVIETLRRLSPPEQWQAFVGQVRAGLKQVHLQLRDLSTRLYQQRTVGSTAAVLLTQGDRGACLWVGDSRVYLLREGGLAQLTHDHSYVQELLDKGLLKPQQAQLHPQGNLITRAIGQREELSVDVVDFPLQAGDVLLLCSDGLYKMLDDMEIAILLSCGGCQDTVQSLIDLALRRGAHDNVTAVVVAITATTVAA